jgi:pimeloyl-ACP methyl ester carboxylesterase
MAFFELASGRKLYYEAEGAGQPVVMIHGWKASADVYAEPSRQLAATGKYRCIRYDHCGHKRSEVPGQAPSLQTLAEDLRELITGMQLEKPILVGWSMGGMTVLEYIRLYGSEDLDRVVIVDIGPKSLNDETWNLGRNGGSYTRAHLEADRVLMEKDFKEFLHNYYLGSQRGYAQRDPAAQRQIVDERMAGFDAGVLASLWYTFNLRDHRPLLPGITCPVAIFYAEILPACPQAVAEYYDAHITAPHRLVCFEGCSHALITEDPDRFSGELLDFFNS